MPTFIDPTTTPTDGDAIDKIARRQTARFLDHLRRHGTYTDVLAADVQRMVKFLVGDIREVVGHSQETPNGQQR